MRTRLGLSLALLALAALPVTATAERAEHRPSAASHSLGSPSTFATQEYTMSTSTSGNAIQVNEHLDQYVSQFGGSGAHHAAAAAARAAVSEITKGEPDSSSFSISITETVSDSSGNLTVSYAVNRKPAPTASAGTAASPSPESGASTSASSAPAGGSSTGNGQQPSSTGTPTTGSLTGATVDTSGAGSPS